MMEARARVIAVAGGIATLEVDAAGACGACGSGGGCLPLRRGGRAAPLMLEDDFGAVPGEHVVIGMTPATLVGAAVAAYGVPLLALVAGVLIGDGLGGGDAGAALGGGMGLAGGLALAALRSRLPGAGPALRPIFLRRVPAPTAEPLVLSPSRRALPAIDTVRS